MPFVSAHEGSPELAVLTTMAAPAIFLLANAMLVLSTIQRLQAILARIRENEDLVTGAEELGPAFDPARTRELLGHHARRARLAHRALLAFYASSAVFVIMIVALGSAGLGLPGGSRIALYAAFLGAGLLLVGTGFLTAETWAGVHATDLHVRIVSDECEELEG